MNVSLTVTLYLLLLLYPVATAVLICSLRTTLCVRFKSSIIACGIIFYVAHKLKVGLQATAVESTASCF